MAVVSVLSYQLTDADGNKKSLPIYVPAAATLANLQLFSDALAALLDDHTDAQITGISATVGLTTPGGLKGTPVAESNVQEGALLSFGLAASNYSHGLFVPGWAQADFSGGEVVDENITALIAQIVTGSNSVAPTSREGLDIDAYINGLKRFRK
jgi:hypothetical protein